MASIKQDLDEYLLLQSDQKKSSGFKIDMKMPQIKVPEIGKIFRNSEPMEANSWLKDTQESICPKLSRLQRILGFVTCLGLGILCMILSTFYIPVLILKARKFALLYTLGSLFFILSFSFLSGFVPFLKHIFSRSRLIPSATYVLCLFLTLYFALAAQNTALTVLFAVAQIISLLLMVVGYFPGVCTGMKFFGYMFKSSVSNTLPV